MQTFLNIGKVSIANFLLQMYDWGKVWLKNLIFHYINFIIYRSLNTAKLCKQISTKLNAIL